MRRSPYSPEGVAFAQSVLTDGPYLVSVDPMKRRELVGMALTLLQNDRAARLGLDGTPPTSCRVIRIPRCLFQAGRTITRRRPRLVVLPATGPTPGDAA